jgi:hypothetical protein
MLVTGAVDCGKLLGGETPGLFQDGLDGRVIEILEKRDLDMAGEARNAVEREEHVGDGGFIRHSFLPEAASDRRRIDDAWTPKPLDVYGNLTVVAPAAARFNRRGQLRRDCGRSRRAGIFEEF